MIAVTGANGLLGNFIVRKLVDNNTPVVAIVRKNSNVDLLHPLRGKITMREADVLHLQDLTTALEGADSVIHAAAVVSFNPRRARNIYEVNVEGTRNVVNACLELKIPKIVHISSVAALGRQKGMNTVDEDCKWPESSLNSDYAESKYLAELEMFRGMEEGLSVSMINPSVILAPSDWTRSSAKLFRYVWDEKIFYTGGSINFVDVRDVADMVDLMVRQQHNGQRFIANGGSVLLKEFFTEIARRFQKKPPSIYVTSPWTQIVARLEEVRSFFTGTEPLVTRQSARLAEESFAYTSKKAETSLGIKFRAIEETLNWCCEEYLRKININK
jgi:dihydroflavonol-4-reductase